MKHVFHKSPNARKTVMRDAHDPEKIYVKTETNEKPGLNANERIRSAGLMPTDKKTGLADGGEIAFSFSFPTEMDYKIAKARDPELFRQLSQGSDEERIRAAERLSFLYPQYLTSVRRGDARRKNVGQKM